MLDPINALAFSVASSKGVYALLLGSGISRSAQIPTGWEITLDLIRKAAVLSGENCNPDPALWYEQKFGAAPDYSELLDKMARTPSERQLLLRGYIEPTEAERARGVKQPTAAHRAIARLVQSGHIRVIITTNFDRLLELALSELGIHPTVIASADQVHGSVPLVHAGPIIIKVHGDYLDTRIRNTDTELRTYEAPLRQLLARVFDEFGLIVCGWSGEWDIALRAAIDRAPARRYSAYWAARGEPSDKTKRLVERRAATLVPIAGADEFFTELQEKIAAVEQLNKPHPLSAELAVATLKGYLPEPQHRIRLHDLVQRELQRTLDAMRSPVFDCDAPSVPEAFPIQAHAYEAAASILASMAFAAGRWSSVEQAAAWVDVVRTLAESPEPSSGKDVLLDLRCYPASLVMYAFCLGAVLGKHHKQIGMITAQEADFGHIGKCALGDRLNSSSVIMRGQDWFKTIKGYDTRKWAGSDRVADQLRDLARNELVSDRDFDVAFAEVELAFAFGYAERLNKNAQENFWAPVGSPRKGYRTHKEIVARWKSQESWGQSTRPLWLMAGLKAKPNFEGIDYMLQRVG